MGVHTVMLCRVTDQPAPAAADIQKALALTKTQLAANNIYLVALSGIQWSCPVGKIGA